MGVAGREAREAEEVAAKKAKHYQGIRVVVFIHDNEATQAAVQVSASSVAAVGVLCSHKWSQLQLLAHGSGL